MDERLATKLQDPEYRREVLQMVLNNTDVEELALRVLEKRPKQRKENGDSSNPGMFG